MATLSFNPDLPPKNDKAHALQLHPVRRKSSEYLDDIALHEQSMNLQRLIKGMKA